MIPKVIHYCWFGGNPKPELVEKCISSWRKYCPEYEIIEWNDDNYCIEKSIFMKEAYDCNKLGFVPDYARFDIILKYGGVYLDTDVELFCSLDDWLVYDAVFSFETERNINAGMGFGAVANHESVKACLKYYNNRHFVINGKMNKTPSPKINTESLCELYDKRFNRNGETQVIDNTCFLSLKDYSKVASHLAMGTWVDGYRKNVTPYRDTIIKRYLRKPENFDFIERHFGKKITDLYTFFAYDMLEYGVLYYIKRIIKRISVGGNN